MEKDKEKLELKEEMQKVIDKLKFDILEKEKLLDKLTNKMETEN